MVESEGVSAEDRVHLFKLAWDLCGEAFGQRVLQYERYYTGDPIRKRAIFYNNHKKQNSFELADEAMKIFNRKNEVTSL